MKRVNIFISAERKEWSLISAMLQYCIVYVEANALDISLPRTYILANPAAAAAAVVL